jgi:sulfoxide reductase heme-binding subunit YedZ
MESTALEISSFAGLAALVVLCFNFLLGLMLGTAYKRSAYWKRLPERIQKINVKRIHNWTAYVAFSLIILHPLILTADEATKFIAADIFIPFHTSYQSFWVAMGIISFYSIVLVIISTQKVIKRKLGFRRWKNIHLISYFSLLLLCLHGIFLDPELKKRSPDFFDGEKLLCEICLVILIVGMIIRAAYHAKQGVSSQNPLS